ncbi:hypothetical protein AN958_04364 [Leucoagaricus sp. SymC.cos]|nr:hypothetical protein AN958_04364 [Leucoagaricus sp. SymC.cos]
MVLPINNLNDLEKRLGGGGGGRGGGGGGGGGGSRGGGSSGGGRGSSGSSGGSRGGSSSSSSRGPAVSVGGSSRPASSSNSGGGPSVKIPSGQPFAGRDQGGGTRGQVFGTKQYGSGYPGIPGRGVSGRGFPFYFWPITWGTAAVVGVGTAAYLDSSHEYGSPDNATRPGGTQYTATFTSSTDTFRLLSDNTTITSLIPNITSSCSPLLSSPSSITPSPYPNDGSSPPRPEQAIQYYRASSIVLTLDGYNNSLAVFGDNDSIPDAPLPPNTNTGLLNCLNETIGRSVPLIDATVTNSAATTEMLQIQGNLGLVLVIWWLLRVVTWI